MSPPVAVRLCESDIEAVAAVEAGSFERPWDATFFRELLRDGWADVRVLKRPEDGLVLAAIVYQMAPGTVDILHLATADGERRRGHARLLLGAVLNEAAASGCANVVLEVRRDNEPAIAFYQAAGFRDVGERRRYYADGTDARVMGRSI